MVVISPEMGVRVTVHLPGVGPVLVKIARLPTAAEWGQVLSQLQLHLPPAAECTVCDIPICVTVCPAGALSALQWQTVLAALTPVQELHLGDGRTYVAPIVNARISCLVDAN